MKQFIINRFEFLPLSVFLVYALWNGEPSLDRWRIAFEISAVAALIHLVAILTQKKPVNRLILAVNFYLMLGGLAVVSKQWWFLEMYNYFRATSILFLMAVIGFITTYFTKTGYIGILDVDKGKTKGFSLYLLIITIICLVISHSFRENTFLAGIVPFIIVVNSQIYLKRTLAKYETEQ